MSGQPRHQYPSDEEIVDRVQSGLHIGQIAEKLGISRATLDSYIATRAGLRDKLKDARQRKLSIVEGQQVTSDDPAEWSDIEALLNARGLKPADWVVVRVRVNEWADQRQLRVDLLPRSMDALLPARAEGWKPPPRLALVPKRDAELVVFFGDHHAPHHDPDLHVAACAWLRKNRPDRGVICGDLLDYDTVSRHRKNPTWTRDAQECVDASYSILRAYIQASPNTRWQLLSGNHEDRMRNAVIDHLSGVYGLARATPPEEERGEAVLSVAHLLRLDELGVEWVGSEDEYSHAQIKVSPHLAARHGWIARKGSGASAVATLDSLRHSVFIGHCHRQAMVFHTAYDIDGAPKELVGVEIGTMSKIAGGLGYVPGGRPDWQQGFATARIWPEDGFFSADLAKFINGSLVWGNQRYNAAATSRSAA